MNDSESLQDRINDWRKDASNLSYEEALQALDLILAELQDDAVPMDVDSNALAHDHNYGKVSLSIELRKNAFFSLYCHNNEICFPKKKKLARGP